MRAWIPILLIAAFSAAPAAARRDDPEAELARMIAGRSAGPPTACISLYPSTNSTTIDTIGIVYSQGRTLYVNRFEGGCSALGIDRIIVTRTPSTRLCRGDIAQVMTRTPAMIVGSCVFGPFTPYAKAK